MPAKTATARAPTISVGGTSSTPAPSTNASTVVLSTTPPVVTFPSSPLGFHAVILAAYRGYNPDTAQVAAIPDVITEVSSSDSYQADLGPAAPEPNAFVTTLTDALGWTNLRAQAEDFLVYVKSQEAVTWKSALIKVDQVKAAYDVALPHNADLPKTYPALARLVDAQTAVARKAAASRKRNAAEKAKTAAASTATASATAASSTTTTPAAPAAPSPSTATATPANGGTATH